MRIKAEMSGKGLTVNAGLLPVLKFMQRLGFQERISKEVSIERSLNAKYHFADAVQMTLVGLIAGATSQEGQRRDIILIAEVKRVTTH